ncbi:MAG: hypothetical protein R2867_29705 [Caldilineaceae bacterium]
MTEQQREQLILASGESPPPTIFTELGLSYSVVVADIDRNTLAREAPLR